MTTNKTVALSSSDLIIQIVPDFLTKLSDTNRIALPETDLGYIVPIRKMLVEQVGIEFCGIMEINTVFVNDKIRRDLLEELYNGKIHFDMYVRQRGNDCPKIIRHYKDCSFHQQEFDIPEYNQTAYIRYYFTNSNDPWQIEESKLDKLVPENQYYYDYAVSKAIKDLQYPLKDIVDSLLWQKKLNEMEKSGKLDKIVDGLLQNVCDH